jgi:hypothetical protein
MDVPPEQFSANSISSTQHLTPANAFHVSVPRKIANFSPHPTQKLKLNWNEYTWISVGNSQTLKVILSTILSLSTNLHARKLEHSIDLNDKSFATLKGKFTEYIAEVERQTGMKIKKQHVDGGGE